MLLASTWYVKIVNFFFEKVESYFLSYGSQSNELDSDKDLSIKIEIFELTLVDSVCKCNVMYSIII